MAEFSVTKQDIQLSNGANVCVLSGTGYLDAHTAPILENAIGQLVNDGIVKVVVNLNQLEYISSAGLGVFMVFVEEIREAGGDLKLTELQPNVFTVFDLLGFPLLFDITSTQSEAINNFG